MFLFFLSDDVLGYVDLVLMYGRIHLEVKSLVTKASGASWSSSCDSKFSFPVREGGLRTQRVNNSLYPPPPPPPPLQ